MIAILLPLAVREPAGSAGVVSLPRAPFPASWDEALRKLLHFEPPVGYVSTVVEAEQRGETPIPGVLRRTILKRVVRALYAEAGENAPPLSGSYAELIRAADRFEVAMGSREALRAGGLRVIERVLPRSVAVAARMVIHHPEVTGKIAVLAVPPAIRWLVGGVERRMYRNRAVIRRCRFLEESGSTVQCIHLCKAPSERFFTERLNIAMRMQPNLKSGECTLTFGREALGAEYRRRSRKTQMTGSGEIR